MDFSVAWDYLYNTYIGGVFIILTCDFLHFYGQCVFWKDKWVIYMTYTKPICPLYKFRSSIVLSQNLCYIDIYIDCSQDSSRWSLWSLHEKWWQSSIKQMYKRHKRYTSTVDTTPQRTPLYRTTNQSKFLFFAHSTLAGDPIIRKELVCKFSIAIYIILIYFM